jgi:hypothetical protein
MSAFQLLIGFAFVSFLIGMGFNVAGIADIRLACLFWFIALTLGLIGVWQQELFKSCPDHWKVALSIILLTLIVAVAWTPVQDKYRQQKTPQRVLVKFSSTQTIQISSSPGPYNEHLNLDNVAVLTQTGAFDRDSITLALLVSPPLGVVNPKASEQYDGSQLPAAGHPGMKTKNLEVRTLGDRFTFHRMNSPRATVKVAGREFVITLMRVDHKSTPRHKLLEYTFGASEQ